MNNPAARGGALVCALAVMCLVVTAVGGCNDDSDVVLALPQKLRFAELSDTQRETLRAEIAAPGLFSGSELKVDVDDGTLSGSFLLGVSEAAAVPVTVRVLGRLTPTTTEVLLARAALTVDVAPRTTARLVFTEDDWAVDGGAIFDPNGNGAPSIDDVIDGFDPAAPDAVLDVSPETLQFPPGLLPGDQSRQIVVVENVSGLPQLVSADVIGALGMSVVLVDATGTADDGAPRQVGPFVLQPFQEQVLAVTFAPSNRFLARGSVALSTLHEASGVRSIHEVDLFGNTDGDPQPVLPGYDAGSLPGGAIGFDGDVVVFPPQLLFGGQPLGPGTIVSAPTTLTIPALGFPSSTVAELPASAVFLVQLPPRHRLAVELSGLTHNVDLGIFRLDGEALATDDDVRRTSRHPGRAPEFLQLRNDSRTLAERAVIVLSRVDDREDPTSIDEGVPYQLLAQLTAGPELRDRDPITPLRGAFRGGTEVTIHGAAFLPGAVVRFGPRLGTATTVADDGTSLTTLTPRADDNAAGVKLPVIVINPDGQAATHPPAFVYWPKEPQVDDVDPPTASSEGGTPLIIRGASFLPGARVRLGDAEAADVVVVSANRIEATSPPGPAGFTQVVVENVDDEGAATPSPSFPFALIAPVGAAPRIDSVTPASGTVGGGDLVTIAGEGFVTADGENEGSTVRIGGSSASGVVVIDAQTITCRTPASFQGGAVVLTVTNPDRRAARSSFTYVQPQPSVVAVTPSSVSTLGGTRLSIDGRDFAVGASALFVAGELSLPAPTVDVVSSNRLLVTAPVGLPVGLVSLTVRNPDGQSSAPATVTAVAPTEDPPRILAVSPTNVRIDALGEITVTGTGFRSGLTVLVDAQPVNPIHVTTSSLRFVAPPRAIGTAIVRVINDDGQSDAAALLYDQVLAPIMVSVAPEVVSAIPGDVLTVRGEHLPAIDESERDERVFVEDQDGRQFPVMVLALDDTTLRVRVTTPLEDGDYVVVLEQDATRVVSPPFAALSPMPVSHQIVAGRPEAGTAFTLLVQGVSLNRERLTAVRFSSDGDVVERVPQIQTSSLVRVDVSADALRQGVWTVALRWDFLDANGAAQTRTIDVPGTLTISGDCGNGIVDIGEACDGDAFDDADCGDVGFFGGTLRCTSRCELDTRACNACGNGLIDDELEECDGANLGGVSCASADPDFTGGAPTCTSDCRLSFVGCSICGNGLVEDGETCDGNNLDAQSCASLGLGFGSGALACRENCQLDTERCDRCGDNRCGASEDRDCSPTFAGCVVCVADCAATCGNGTCDVGESCQTCPRDCASTCRAPFSLSLQSGGGQSAPLASDVGLPVVVAVRDSEGAPLVGVQITFSAPPGGNASPATTLTNSSGAASALFTVPRGVGAASFVASGSGPDGTLLQGAPLSISATATDLNQGLIQTLVNQFATSGPTETLGGGAATKTRLNLGTSDGSGIALRESDGSIFVADTANHRVLRIDAHGAIFHVAGSTNGTSDFTGDNGAATSAQLNTPRGLALNAAGELFIADSLNNRVRRVDGNGIITTVVGGGTSTLENVLATTARLTEPVSLVFDASGALYVQQTTSAQLIRRVAAAAQTIQTVVTSASCFGSGVAVSSVDRTQLAFDQQGRLLFVGSVINGGGCPVASTQHLLRLEHDGSLSSVMGGSVAVATGQARGARLETAVGVAVDPAGNIFFSEAGTAGRRIRRITPLGVVSTVAGTGVSGFSGDGRPAGQARFIAPGSLAMNSQRDLVVVDRGSHTVRMIRALGEATPPAVDVTVLGDNQSVPITQALPTLLGLRVIDSNNNPVPGVTLVVTTTPGAAAEPSAVITDENGVASFIGFVGRSPGPATFSVAATSADGLPLPGSPFVLTATAVDIADDAIVAVLGQEGAQGNSPGGGSAARARVNLDTSFAGVAVDPDDGTIYVADVSNHRVLRIAPSGRLTQIAGTGVSGRGSNGPALTVALQSPRGLALDDDKNLYIADSANDYVRVLRTANQDCPNGCALSIFAGNAPNDSNPADGLIATAANLDNPIAVAVSPEQDAVFIVDQGHSRVRRVAMDPGALGVPGVIASPIVGQTCTGANGLRINSFSGGGSGLAFDHAGRLYVVGAMANGGGCPAPSPNETYVFRLELDGALSIIAGGGIVRSAGPAFDTTLSEPAGLAVDVAGNLYVAERFTHRIRRIDVLGRMTVIAGDGVAGRAGDGGPATASRLNGPTALAFGPGGDLFIADNGNDSLRMIRRRGDDVPVSARVVTDAGDGQAVIQGQNTPTPLRVRVLEAGTTTPVSSQVVRFIAQNPGDSVFAPQTTTDATGFAFTSVRYGRTRGTDHVVVVDAVTWLEGVPLLGLPVSFAGTGLAPPQGATVAVVNSFGQTSGRIPADGTGQSLPAVDARPNLTGAGVALAADGTLFLVDTDNHRILEISPEGVASVFAGTGTSGFVDNTDRLQARFSFPSGIAVDTDGSVYVADTNNRRIRRITTAGTVSTFAGGNPADPPGHGDGNDPSIVNFNSVEHLRFGPDGALYASDGGHDTIRRLVVRGPFAISTPVTSDNCTAAKGLRAGNIESGGFDFDSQGRLILVALVNNGGACAFATATPVIMRNDGPLTGPPSTSFTFIAGSPITTSTGDGLAANVSRLTDVRGLVIEPDDDIYFLESIGSHRLRRIPGGLPSSLVQTVVGVFNSAGFSAFTSPGTGQLTSPHGLTRDPTTGDLVITEDGSDAVRIVVP